MRSLPCASAWARASPWRWSASDAEGAAALTLVVAAASANAQVDPRLAKELGSNAPGAADHLLPRYGGSFLLAQTRKDFDELTLPLGKAVGSTYQTDADKKLRYEKT